MLSEVAGTGEPGMSMVPVSYVRKRWLEALSRLACGTLEFISPEGERIVAKGRTEGPHARFELTSWDVLRRVLARGDIGLGEEYIAGTWSTDDIERLISLFLLNMDGFDAFANGNALNRFALVLHNRLV